MPVACSHLHTFSFEYLRVLSYAVPPCLHRVTSRFRLLQVRADKSRYTSCVHCWSRLTQRRVLTSSIHHGHLFQLSVAFIMQCSRFSEADPNSSQVLHRVNYRACEIEIIRSIWSIRERYICHPDSFSHINLKS